MPNDVHRFPPIEPQASWLLAVGDGNAVYWEEFGDPAGKAALVVHGGPGTGRSGYFRRSFDPDRYRWIEFDQRGCGLSTPHAADPAVDMAANTTGHLIADMERLRERLGVERWLLAGGSWGSTLILAYAQQHPERVSEILLVGVTTTRRSEVDWLDWGLRRFLPAAFECFHALAPHASSGVELAAAYNRLLSDPDPSVRANAADAWCEWENAVISHEQDGAPDAFDGFVGDQRLAFVRICTHYFAHGAFLDEGALLNGAGKLAGIPGILIHGRLDLGAPLETAWDLANVWPDAELIITDAGHTGNDQTRHEVVRALDRFAAR